MMPERVQGANEQQHLQQASDLLLFDHLSDPAAARAYADWHASRFGAFEAQRQSMSGRKGPVAAEMDSERKRVQQLRRAQSLADEASVRLDELSDRQGRAASKERSLAEEQLARARGVIDRLRYEDEVRRSVAIPPELAYYSGVTRGFEPPADAPRTEYVDARPQRSRSLSQSGETGHGGPLSTLSRFFGVGGGGGGGQRGSGGGEGRGATSRRSASQQPYARAPSAVYAPMAPSSSMEAAAAGLGATDAAGLQWPLQQRMASMPTAAPLPNAGARFRGSNVPTPYGMPEVCFAWDMLLRSATATDKLAARPTAAGVEATMPPYSQRPLPPPGLFGNTLAPLPGTFPGAGPTFPTPQQPPMMPPYPIAPGVPAYY